MIVYYQEGRGGEGSIPIVAYTAILIIRLLNFPSIHTRRFVFYVFQQKEENPCNLLLDTFFFFFFLYFCIFYFCMCGYVFVFISERTVNIKC